MKVIKRLKRLIFGKPPKRIPSIQELQWRATRSIGQYKIKYINSNQLWHQMGEFHFLVVARYPDNVRRRKNEVGANIASRTRYILKNDTSQVTTEEEVVK